MAFFGRKPKKPGSVPGAASGGPEQDAMARLSGLVRRGAQGRAARQTRTARVFRALRNERRAR